MNKHKKSFEAAFIFVLISFFGALALKQGFLLYRFGHDLQDRGMTTVGTVTAFKEGKDIDGGNQYWPIVQFADNTGQTHTFTNKIESRDFSTMFVGASTTVFFLADTPNNATIETPSYLLWNSAFYLAMGVVFFIIAVVAAYRVYCRAEL